MERYRMLYVLVFFMSFVIVEAQIPRIINYQGMLMGADAKPLAEGDYKITFSIYDESNKLLWSEVHEKVYVAGGLFHVLLGTVTHLEIGFDQPYALGIKINEDPELTPRMLITSSAYSLNSERVGGYEVSPNPEPNTLLPLDNAGKIPSSALPGGTSSGDFLAKNIADSTKGAFDGEMLRIENTGNGRGMTVISSGSHGIYGKSTSGYAAVEGEGASSGPGVRGSSVYNHGVIGYTERSSMAGIYGNNPNVSTSARGVWGNSLYGSGVYGFSRDYIGVYGYGTGNGAYGVAGVSNAGFGIYGYTQSNDTLKAAVYAHNNGSGPAIYSKGDIYTTGKFYGNIGPSDGAPFPTPAYDSDWIPVSHDYGTQAYLFEVDKYLPTTNYGNNKFIVDLMIKENGIMTNRYIGDKVYYEIESNNSITVYVSNSYPDINVTDVNLRVWYKK